MLRNVVSGMVHSPLSSLPFILKGFKQGQDEGHWFRVGGFLADKKSKILTLFNKPSCLIKSTKPSVF